MPDSSPKDIRIQLISKSRGGADGILDLSEAASLEWLANNEEAIAALVDRLYERLLKSPRLQVYFLEVDTARLRLHQSHFMMQLFSGAGTEKLHTLRAVHKRLVDNLGLGPNDFDEFRSLATATLREFSLPDRIVDEFLHRIDTLREWVLGLSCTREQMTLDEFFEMTGGGEN